MYRTAFTPSSGGVPAVGRATGSAHQASKTRNDDELAEEAQKHGLGCLGVRREISEMADVTVAATANRAVLGSMNDFTNMIHAYWGPNATLRDITLKAAEAPCGPLDMATPIDATVDLLAREHRCGAV